MMFLLEYIKKSLCTVGTGFIDRHSISISIKLGAIFWNYVSLNQKEHCI